MTPSSSRRAIRFTTLTTVTALAAFTLTACAGRDPGAADDAAPDFGPWLVTGPEVGGSDDDERLDPFAPEVSLELQMAGARWGSAWTRHEASCPAFSVFARRAEPALAARHAVATSDELARGFVSRALELGAEVDEAALTMCVDSIVACASAEHIAARCDRLFAPPDGSCDAVFEASAINVCNAGVDVDPTDASVRHCRGQPVEGDTCIDDCGTLESGLACVEGACRTVDVVDVGDACGPTAWCRGQAGGETSCHAGTCAFTSPDDLETAVRSDTVCSDVGFFDATRELCVTMALPRVPEAC